MFQDVNQLPSRSNDNPLIIVSLTSHPARIHLVTQVLESLYTQSLKAYRILLWLAEEQFPNKLADLPDDLVSSLHANIFELRWCDDLGSHKKYFYAMQEFPDSIIVTVDDDFIYHRDWLKVLYTSYLRYPHAVSAMVVNLFLFDDEGHPLPPSKMLFDFHGVRTPSLQLMATGAGGILYPPRCLDERVFDKETILRELASGHTWTSDDEWLKVHEVLHGTPVVLATDAVMKMEVFGSQEKSLGKMRSKYFHPDDHFEAIRRHYLKKGKDELSESMRIAVKAQNYVPDDRKLRYDYVVEDVGLKIASTKEGWGIYSIEKLPEYIRRALSGINHQMSREGVCGTERDAIQRLRAYALDIDGIEDLAAKDISLRGLIEYGAVLRRGMLGGFRTTDDYRQMLANWQAFLKSHPDCDSAYMTAYQAFLKDMKNNGTQVCEQTMKGNVPYKRLLKDKSFLAKLFSKNRM